MTGPLDEPPPPRGPGGDAGGVDQGGPLLQLLTAALQLWVRGQCERVESLEIELRGSGRSLLRGRLAGVRVRARGVSYQRLQLELVDLTSGPLQVQMGNLWRGRPVQLQEPFQIRGLVGFTSSGLNHSLAQPQWRDLADQLAEQLLGITPLVRVDLRAERLVLAAQGVGEPQPVEVEATIGLREGALELATLDGGHRSLVPFDPALRLEQALIEAGMLMLEGEATVIP